MGCGCGQPKREKLICVVCGKEEEKEIRVGEKARSCCGQPMRKKES